jgi:hypothetical protein
MQKSQLDSVSLILAALAGAVALTQISGPLAWMSSIGGLALLLILFSFDQEGYRTVFQSLAFSAVCGFCTAIAAGAIFQAMANHGEVHLGNGQWVTEYLPLTCAFATAIFWAIDVMRMNARKAVPIHVPRALGDTSLFGARPAPTPEPAVYAPPYPVSYAPPQPVSYAPSQPVSYAPPQPVMAPQPPPPAVPVQQPGYNPVLPPQPPAQPAPVQRAPEPEPAPPPQAAALPREIPTATSIFAVPSAPAAPEPQAPNPTPVSSRSGKETMIYVSLLNEGLNVLRSVRAEPLGHDYYRIIDEMPENETWQFQPGQVVRCKKKALSSGKAMVAMEEAPRSA